MARDPHNHYLYENVLKNIIIITILLVIFKPVEARVALIGAEQFTIVLTVLGSLLLASLFGCFAFTYEKSIVGSTWDRHLGHVTVGLMMFVVGVSFEIILAIFKIAVPSLAGIFTILAVLTYLSVIGYDFWDFRRVKFQK